MKKKTNIALFEEIHVTLQVANPYGGWFPLNDVPNVDLVVNAGRTAMASRIGSNSPDPVSHMAVGTVSTAPSLTDTAATGEIVRKALAVNSATDNNLYTAIATFGGAADGITSVTIREAALFNHADSGQGTMSQRITFSGITLAASDLLSITMKTRVGSNTI